MATQLPQKSSPPKVRSCSYTTTLEIRSESKHQINFYSPEYSIVNDIPEVGNTKTCKVVTKYIILFDTTR